MTWGYQRDLDTVSQAVRETGERIIAEQGLAVEALQELLIEVQKLRLSIEAQGRRKGWRR